MCSYLHEYEKKRLSQVSSQFQHLYAKSILNEFDTKILIIDPNNYEQCENLNEILHAQNVKLNRVKVLKFGQSMSDVWLLRDF